MYEMSPELAALIYFLTGAQKVLPALVRLLNPDSDQRFLEEIANLLEIPLKDLNKHLLLLAKEKDLRINITAFKNLLMKMKREDFLANYFVQRVLAGYDIPNLNMELSMNLRYYGMTIKTTHELLEKLRLFVGAVTMDLGHDTKVLILVDEDPMSKEQKLEYILTALTKYGGFNIDLNFGIHRLTGYIRTK